MEIKPGYIIYCATSKTTGKSYVGQTTASLVARQRQHLNNGQSLTGNLFHDALYELGWNDFDWQILETGSDPSIRFAREKYWSNEIGSYEPTGYNPIPGSRQKKPVICIETGRKFTSLQAAAEYCGVVPSTITQSILQKKAVGCSPETNLPVSWQYYNKNAAE